MGVEALRMGEITQRECRKLEENSDHHHYVNHLLNDFYYVSDIVTSTLYALSYLTFTKTLQG